MGSYPVCCFECSKKLDTTVGQKRELSKQGLRSKVDGFWITKYYSPAVVSQIKYTAVPLFN